MEGRGKKKRGRGRDPYRVHDATPGVVDIIFCDTERLFKVLQSLFALLALAVNSPWRRVRSKKTIKGK
jgi:hypothetical protein